MPDALFFVAGTTTGAGKTWVAARLCERLRSAGTSVAARKPVQSFAPDEGATDAEVLARASGTRPEEVCGPARSYALAMAPPMAAEALGSGPIRLRDLVGELDLPHDGIVVVEGVGGPRSPIAHDGDNADLAARLRPDAVVLVADAGLGAINAVRLSIEPFAHHHTVVFLNHFNEKSDLERRNRHWLARYRCEVVTEVDDLVLHLLGDTVEVT